MRRWIRRAWMTLCFVLPVVSFIFWGRSHAAQDRFVSVTYFNHLTPKWFFLRGVESDDGSIILTESYSEMLDADAKAGGTMSEYGNLAVDDAPAVPRAVLWAHTVDQPTHYRYRTDTAWRKLGFGDYWEFGYRNPSWGRQMFVPYWAVTLLLGLYPLWMTILLLRRGYFGWRRSTRIANRECVQCGYDLRRSPERCPECGLAREDREVKLEVKA